MKLTVCCRWTKDTAPREPSLSDVLNDPVVRAVMRADGVDPDELARILDSPFRDRLLGRPRQPT